MSNPINKKYEKLHFNEQDRVVSYINKQYNSIINQITPLVESGASRLIVQRKLNQLLKQFRTNVTAKIENGVKYSWDISNQRNLAYFQQRLSGYTIPDKVKQALFNPNTNRLEAFIQRKEGGLELSDRVWKSAQQFRSNVDMSLDVGIAEGKSAKQIGRELRQNLNEPDKLFRRVRDSRGKLQLSKPAKAYNPGQGVYRSATRNSERLARTETNMGYRAADDAAWQNNPLVLGYEIRLSATAKPKTRCELCRTLEGKYPVWFNFRGWHPNCLCFKIPILMNDEMMAAYQKLVVKGIDTEKAIADLQNGARIESPPDDFSIWVTENSSRVDGWKQKPYWWKDNSVHISTILKVT
jgi:hypothetical protein